MAHSARPREAEVAGVRVEGAQCTQLPITPVNLSPLLHVTVVATHSLIELWVVVSVNYP